MDFKYDDVRKMEDKSIDLCLFNGAIRNSENEEIAHLLRAKSKVLSPLVPAHSKDAFQGFRT